MYRSNESIHPIVGLNHFHQTVGRKDFVLTLKLMTLNGVLSWIQQFFYNLRIHTHKLL